MLDDPLDFCTAVAGREQAPVQPHGGPATEKNPSPQRICTHWASEPPPGPTYPKYVPDKIVAVPTFKTCNLKVMLL